MKIDFGSVRLNAARIMLRPIVRFVLKGTHSIQEFLEVVKVVFVEVAADEIAKLDAKVNVSRITMMTGLHRIEVNRFFKGDVAESKQGLNSVIQIIGQWQTDSRFTTKDKKPKILSYKGDDNEFCQLLESVSKSIIPGTALFELERIGAVKKTARGIKLIKTEFLSEEYDEMYNMLGTGISAFIQSAIENMQYKGGKQDPRKHPNVFLVTEFDNISQADVEDLRKWMYENGTALHKDAREAFSKRDKDIAHGRLDEAAGARVVLGAFSFTESDLLGESEQGVELK